MVLLKEGDKTLRKPMMITAHDKGADGFQVDVISMLSKDLNAGKTPLDLVCMNS